MKNMNLLNSSEVEILYKIYYRNIDRYIELFGTANGSYILNDILDLGFVFGKSKNQIIQDINSRRERKTINDYR